MIPRATDRPWRTGPPPGREIYACSYGPGEMIGGADSPFIVVSDEDEFVGLMETPELAEHVVRVHNAELRGRA